MTTHARRLVSKSSAVLGQGIGHNGLGSERFFAIARRLHAEMPDYGNAGDQFVPVVTQLIDRLGFRSVLDFGCGKGRFVHVLRQHLAMRGGIIVEGFDPAVPGYDAEAGPADLVTCFDVLDQVDPSCLDATLAYISGLTRSTALFALLSEAVLPGVPTAGLQVKRTDRCMPGRAAELWATAIGRHFDIYDRGPYGEWTLFAGQPLQKAGRE